MIWLVPLASAGTARDAWGRKPVLDVTLSRRWDELDACGLTDAQVAGLRSLARDVAVEADAWRQQGNAALRRGQSPDAPLQRAAVAALSEREAEETADIVGDALPCLLDVLDAGWAEDRAALGPVFTSTSVTYNVYATQYDANTDDEVAVPDQCIKFANLGWSTCSSAYASPPYHVLLDNGGHTYTAWVGDVGPWNVDDNYWDTTSGDRPRRRFTDLAQGLNESRAAYYDDYNGGEDQYGRTVGNPAGIDLAPDTAGRIGLAYLQNAWINVTWLWEGSTIYPLLSVGISQDARADQPPDTHQSDGIYDVYPGQQWTVPVTLTNSGTEKANNVTLGAWIEAPYLKVVRWQTSDGQTGEDPGDTFTVPFGGIDAGETESVTFTLEAEQASIGLADHPDLRVWVSHIDNYYEKSDFSSAPSANSYQTWNGGELLAYAQHDVWPLETSWGWDDGSHHGWWAGNAVDLDPSNGTLKLTASGDDPYAFGPWISASAEEYPAVSWRGAHLGSGPVTLYWTTLEDPAFDDAKSVTLPVAEAQMAWGSAEPGWTGTISRLRLDPGPSADAILTLDELALGAPEGDTPSTAGEDTAGAIPDLPGTLVLMEERDCGCGAVPTIRGAWTLAGAAALVATRRRSSYFSGSNRTARS